MFKLIVISSPSLLADEACVINALFARGMERFHLRKPDATSAQVSQLVSGIEPRYYQRITMHYHFDVAEQFALGGVHVNARCPEPPSDWRGLVSTSCHSLSEVEQLSDTYSYAFLSPIFDSISKVGYNSAFSTNDIANAAERGLINERIIALGGITPQRIAMLDEWGFGGCAVLGAIWKCATIGAVCANFDSFMSSVRLRRTSSL